MPQLSPAPAFDTFPPSDMLQERSQRQTPDLTIIQNNIYGFIDDIGLRCVEAFFSYFHRAHPFTLPRAQFLAYTKNKPLPLLNAAIRYIGSCYLPAASTPSILAEIENLLVSPEIGSPKDGFTVQAMMLVAIGLDAHKELTRASQILDSACNLALELGMQHEEFASRNNQGSAFLEESWRRTFWELYVIDGQSAGTHQSRPFSFHGMSASARLPCEERQYELGVSSLDNLW